MIMHSGLVVCSGGDGGGSVVVLVVDLRGGHVDDVALGGVAQLDVPVGQVVQPGQLPPGELLAGEGRVQGRPGARGAGGEGIGAEEDPPDSITHYLICFLLI